MKIENALQYFKKGFYETNKSLGLLFISLLLTSPSLLQILLGKNRMNPLLLVISLIFIFMSMGFSLSLPVFLHMRRQKKLEATVIFNETVKNTKRSIVPIILIAFTLCIAAVILFITSAIISPSTANTLLHLNQKNPYTLLISIASSVIFSFSFFTSIFFSIEKMNLIDSIKKSLNFSIKHIEFTFLLLIALMLNVLVSHLLLSSNILIFILKSTISLYVIQLLTCSALLYYQDKV